MATVIRHDGVSIEIFPVNRRHGLTLEEMYEAIGCTCIDIVDLASGELMVWDDEARLANKPINTEATVRFLEGRDIDCAIRGNVIVASRKEIK